MWKVQFKPDDDTQTWSVLGGYDNKAHAFIHAARVFNEYFMVEVIAPDGNVVWSNYN